MSRKLFALLALITLALVWLSACANTTTANPIATISSTPEPTYTIIPPTSTPEPSPTPRVGDTPEPTATPTTIPTPDKIVHESYGFYRHCEPDEKIPQLCVCTDYNFNMTITQVPIGDGLYETTIEFTFEYSDTMYLNDFQNQTSMPITTGTSLILPLEDWTKWDVSTQPFFEEVTP